MLFMPSHLTQRAGIFYFRARVPTHLVEAFGRSIVSLSLGTRDPSEARRRARERRVEFERALAQLEPAAPARSDDWRGSVLHLSDADIEALCERYRAQRLLEDEQQRMQGLSAGAHELDLDLLEIALPRLRSAYARGDLSDVHADLKRFLDAIGLKVSRSSPSYERLARRFQQVDLELHEALFKRRSGVPVDVPAIAAGNALRLADVLACWKRHGSRRPKTVRSFEQAFELLDTHCHAANARLLKKADAIAFRNALQDKGDHSPRTIGKMIGFLRAAFQCAVDDDLLEANPFAGVKVTVNELEHAGKSRLPFEMQELQAIFSGPVYQPGFRPRPSLGQACHWLPLMALFTGARLEELAQLEVADIQPDPVAGHRICIRHDVGRSQRTKNANSVRDIPLHPRLAKLGFLEYVRSCGSGPLFPALRADRYGKRGTVFSTWFGRYLDQVGIRSRTRVFHSFRHSFVQRAKERVELVPVEVREALVGHLSARHIEMVYGHRLYPIEPLTRALAHIDWPELDLRHLEPS
ncbi:site-specific integrase [Azohydromonas sediminis]|uniref:site-specific integrase n=1 Tax=Azohydromonas sediminis TaxID=2259674 RepID=UPI000E6460EA|nr:site-specific integrase [Azohydromonas sediminis]